MPKCFVVNPADNVATMLDDVLLGELVQVIGQPAITLPIISRADIQLGHKIAIKAIRHNEPICKFGVTIGHATSDIVPGDWVHLHNLSSAFDERSQTFDAHSGATTDTKYE